ncbi:MAG: 3-isopropylmalate dehydratase small subunit [Candidatus Atribacteria bacterium]|nr:MAG: 3-isopropylmalate dehydratase small subunit [Candidatus Atribacteria bacterium]
MTETRRVWLFGDHVDTDAIIPACHLYSSDPAQLASHCMEGIDAGFASAVQPGDVMVAGDNFGCGSSREHAPLAIKAAGIRYVVANGFARIFYRNAINIGLPVIVCPEAVAAAAAGQRWEVDLESGVVRNLTLDTQTVFEPFPPFMMELLRAGGLTAHTRNRIEAGDLPLRRNGT